MFCIDNKVIQCGDKIRQIFEFVSKYLDKKFHSIIVYLKVLGETRITELMETPGVF